MVVGRKESRFEFIGNKASPFAYDTKTRKPASVLVNRGQAGLLMIWYSHFKYRPGRCPDS